MTEMCMWYSPVVVLATPTQSIAGTWSGTNDEGDVAIGSVGADGSFQVRSTTRVSVLQVKKSAVMRSWSHKVFVSHEVKQWGAMQWKMGFCFMIVLHLLPTRFKRRLNAILIENYVFGKVSCRFN